MNISGSTPQYRPTAVQLSQPFDVIVIGAGINGSGIARDAAERGLKVLLVDKNDFGAATSTANSRLIHGGLRYCENLEFGLVRESLRERENLLYNAPHLVKPLPLGIPIYKGAKRGYWIIKLGMILYDMLSYDKTLPKHKMMRRDEFLKNFPGVEEKDLVGGAVYYDAQVDLPERLCLENVLAAKAHGAVVMNHAQVESVIQENQRASGLQIKDLVTGESHAAKSRMIINASGIWVDQILKMVKPEGAKAISRKIGGTKGSHIIVRKFPGGPDQALYVEAKKDGRPFFIIPWRKDYYLIGTTDFPYKGDLDKIVADQDEIEYLKEETKRVFPKAELDILYTYSGVRPLPYVENTKAGKITRKHIIFDHAREGIEGFVSIIGGKLTTFRSLAEEAVDYILKKRNPYYNADSDQLNSESEAGTLKKLRMSFKKSTTRRNQMPGGKGIGNIGAYRAEESARAVSTYGISQVTAEALIDLYGSRYGEVLALTQERPEWKLPIVVGRPEIRAQVVYAVRNEMAMSTADVLMRRTGIALHEGVGLEYAEATARLVGEALGWTEAQIREDVAQYTKTVMTLNQPFKVPASSKV